MTTTRHPRHTRHRARHIGRSTRAQARREARVFAALAGPAVLCAAIDGPLGMRGAGWAGAVLWAGVAVTGAAAAARGPVGAA